MKTLPVRFGPEADEQLGEIERYIALQGAPDAGRDFVEAIVARCFRIGDVPYGGTPRDDLIPSGRTVPYKRSATILYTVEDAYVVVQGVFYGGRDIDGYYGSR